MAKPTKAKVKQVALQALRAEFPEVQVKEGKDWFALYFDKGRPEEFGFVWRMMTLADVKRAMRARRLKAERGKDADTPAESRAGTEE